MPVAHGELGVADQRRLVRALQSAWPARCDGEQAELIETHISWVLAGRREALKIKKAVGFGFVDFTTLERRRHFCAEELRLNGRLAPALYLEALPITGTPDAPRLRGDGAPIEFAVRMRAFEQDQLWDRLARAGALQPVQIDDLAAQLARFHGTAAAAPAGSRHGEPQRVRAAVLENFDTIAAAGLDDIEQQQLGALRRWEAATFEAIAPLLARRRAAGRVRECHGDLHLGNVAQVEGRCTVFDGIDFSEDLRFIDVISDVAFMAMDLHHHRLPGLARRFVDRYLGCCGDYEGARLLRYFAAYRALVRGKIALLRARQDTASCDAARLDLREHLALAARLAGLRPEAAAGGRAHAPDEDLPPALLITHGPSGSGKTRGTQRLVESGGVLRIRADVERKRLAGIDERSRSGSAPGGGLYTPELTRATYARLLEAAVPVIEGGSAAVLDATWLQHTARQEAAALASRLGVSFVILDFAAPPPLLLERVRRRQASGSDASEADEAVLAGQLRRAEALAPDEQAAVLACPAALDDADPASDLAWQALFAALRDRLEAAEASRRWYAMEMAEPAPQGRPLQQVWREQLPLPGPGEVRIAVAACGVCRTDLHIVDGELAWPGHAVVPGHEIVGRVAALGAGVTALAIGQRVGVPWLGWTCGTCRHCRAGRENLCEQARFTGWQIAGGYAQQVVADARYVFPLPERYSDLEAAPLLCAGLIGWRALTMAGNDAQRLGIYGFGAAAHLITQVAVHLGREVHAFTREGDTAAQQLARELGARWSGSSAQPAAVELDATLVFAPVGALVPAALRALRPGGTVVCAGIHMSDIPSFPYAWLWRERRIVSVANLTRADGEAFLRLAGELPLKVCVRPYRLADANAALDDLRAGRFSGAAVLQA